MTPELAHVASLTPGTYTLSPPSELSHPSGFHMGSGDLNCGPQACTSNALSTEPATKELHVSRNGKITATEKSPCCSSYRPAAQEQKPHFRQPRSQPCAPLPDWHGQRLLTKEVCCLVLWGSPRTMTKHQREELE